MRSLPLFFVGDEVGSLLVKTSLVSGIFSATGTALFDAAEEDDGCDDEDNTSDGSKDGDLSSLGECAPAVPDTVGRLDFFQSS
jgi:hypothetical protein